MNYSPNSQTKTPKYKPEYMSESLDNYMWHYDGSPKAAIKLAIKNQNKVNGIAKQIEEIENLDTILLQENN